MHSVGLARWLSSSPAGNRKHAATRPSLGTAIVIRDLRTDILAHSSTLPGHGMQFCLSMYPCVLSCTCPPTIPSVPDLWAPGGPISIPLRLRPPLSTFPDRTSVGSSELHRGATRGRVPPSLLPPPWTVRKRRFISSVGEGPDAPHRRRSSHVASSAPSSAPRRSPSFRFLGGPGSSRVEREEVPSASGFEPGRRREV